MYSRRQNHLYKPVILLIFTLCSFLTAGRLTDPPLAPIRPVAEFERSQGVLISYPFGIPTSFIAAMSQDVMVYCLVASYDQTYCQNSLQSAGTNMENLELVIANTDSYWTQDYGPFFVVDGNHQMGVVDFEYNRPRPLDNQIPLLLSNYFDVPYFDSDIVHNGGNLMFDGYQTAASSTIVFTENPSINVDERMADYYGALTHMTVADPTGNYHQHINCWAKFLAPDKIIVREVPPNHFYFNQTEDVVDFYANQTNCFGEPYKIYRVYTPADEPYANSFILNDKVYIPVSGGQWDDDAIASFEEALPGYEVIGIQAWDWLPTDALHCRVMAIPDLEMLQILHNPIDDQEFPLNEYTVSAIIDPLSEQGLIPDSLALYWRHEVFEEFLRLPLQSTAEFQEYAAAIPNQPLDGVVQYFLTAADSSGRIERLPLAGAFEFQVLGGYPAQLGDVNQDEGLNILDIILIVNHIINVNHLSGYAFYLADMDGNDQLNILDIIFLNNQIIAGE